MRTEPWMKQRERFVALMTIRGLRANTRTTYLQWLDRFHRFHGGVDLHVLGAEAVRAFINHLVVERRVSASTQKQALSAVLFFYRHLLGIGMEWVDGIETVKRKPRLPKALVQPLRDHLERVREQHQVDLRSGAGWVELPNAIAAKYPNAGRSWSWHWVFPATRHYTDPETGERRRHHLHPTKLQRDFKQAVRRSGITKLASCHTLRHYAGLRIMPSGAPVRVVHTRRARGGTPVARSQVSERGRHLEIRPGNNRMQQPVSFGRPPSASSLLSLQLIRETLSRRRP